jgi:glutaredoxin
LPALLLLSVLLAADAAPVAAAKAHLAAGQLDDVLFDLDGKTLSDSDKGPAADVLARAAQAAWRKDDDVMTLQLAQMALRLSADQVLALEMGARASRAQKQYSPAEDYSNRWVEASHGNARARLLRSELATDQGEWQQGLDVAQPVKEADLSPDDRARLKLVRDTCKKELAERHVNIKQVKSIEAKLDVAAEKARRMPDHPAHAEALQPPSPADEPVVLYTRGKSSSCAQARRYLQSKHVAYTEKDLDRDRGAASELVTELARTHQRVDVVPIINVRGTFVHGFKKEELDRLLW